jgi:hypothetical protein
VDFPNVGASAPGGGDAGDSLFSLVRALVDTKTQACGKNYRSFRAEDPYKPKTSPVEQRAALVPKQYLSNARSLDHQLHGTARGAVGPIEARVRESFEALSFVLWLLVCLRRGRGGSFTLANLTLEWVVQDTFLCFTGRVLMNTASKLGPHTQTDRGTCPGVGL